MSTEPEQVLRELEARRIDALLTRDWQALEALAHPDLTYLHSIGRRDDRASLLAVLRDGGLEYHAIEEDLEAFVTTSDLLWASGTMRSDLTGGGRRMHLESLVTVLWVRDAGRWRFRAFQGTASAAAPALDTARPDSR